MTAEPRNIDNLIRYQVDSGIARITIDAAAQGNALAGDMRDRLAERFREASEDLAVRAVTLRGAGERHFCTGAALGGAQRPGPARPEDAPERTAGEVARLIRHGWQALIASILDCEKPVIAAVNGTAAGGGAQLALACDLVVMADTAKFIQVFVRRGIMPDAGGAYLLPRLVGMHRAKELMFLGDDCNADRAEHIGLVNRVLPAAELLPEAKKLAHKIASRAPVAVQKTKQALHASRQGPLSEGNATERQLFSDLFATADQKEGMTAFLQKRPPTYTGQ